MIISWIYQRSFVADGNFKADHIRQKDTGDDIWLSEGGGMTAKRADYEEFLRTAINRLTVSLNDIPLAILIEPIESAL